MPAPIRFALRPELAIFDATLERELNFRLHDSTSKQLVQLSLLHAQIHFTRKFTIKFASERMQSKHNAQLEHRLYT